MEGRLKHLKGHLIVSCQALPDEPFILHSLWEEWHWAAKGGASWNSCKYKRRYCRNPKKGRSSSHRNYKAGL